MLPLWVLTLLVATGTEASPTDTETRPSAVQKHQSHVSCLLNRQVPTLPRGVAEIFKWSYWGEGLDFRDAKAQVWRAGKYGEGTTASYLLVGESYIFSERNQTPVYVKTGDELAWLLPETQWRKVADFDDTSSNVILQCNFYSCNDRGLCTFAPTRALRLPSLILDLAPRYNIRSEEAWNRYRRPSDNGVLSLGMLVHLSELNALYDRILASREKCAEENVNWRSLTVFLDLSDLHLISKTERDAWVSAWKRLRYNTQVSIAASLITSPPETLFKDLSLAAQFLDEMSAGPLVVLVPEGRAPLAYDYLFGKVETQRILVLEAAVGGAGGAGLLPKTSVPGLHHHPASLISGWKEDILETVAGHVESFLSAGPNVWAVFVLLIQRAVIDDGSFAVMLQVLGKVQTTYGEALALRSVREVMRSAHVPSSVDLSSAIDASLTYAQLMRLREKLLTEEAGSYLDKVRLRREASKIAKGVPLVPNIYASSVSAEILEHLRDRRDYVVKVSHMARSEYVFIVSNGSLLMGNLTGAEGATLEERIQHKVREGFAQTGAKGAVCGPQNLVALPPGVVVEELVMENLPHWDKPWVVEIRVHVVWGTALVVDVAWGHSGAFLFMRYPQNEAGANPEAAGGTWMVEGLHSEEGAYPAGSYAFMDACVKVAVEQAERFAEGLDHIRVDFLSRAHCSELFLSELAFCPAVIFNPVTDKVLASAWVYGYGVDP
ncbi:unnamed protein product [Polarella glacialis]|uniref:Uncharacterized protein n=1 Tax=Polarella glacialis TaxID=89957 RepID=A0A813D774_POLGL|nr:unnamed protein product [Polarella glacialis]CAE8729639.1 unnamed protein product [Polarella glacialis]